MVKNELEEIKSELKKLIDELNFQSKEDKNLLKYRTYVSEKIEKINLIQNIANKKDSIYLDSMIRSISRSIDEYEFGKLETINKILDELNKNSIIILEKF